MNISIYEKTIKIKVKMKILKICKGVPFKIFIKIKIL